MSNQKAVTAFIESPSGDELGARAKLLLVILTTKADEHGSVQIGRAELARMASSTEPTVTKGIKELIAAGLVEEIGVLNGAMKRRITLGRQS